MTKYRRQSEERPTGPEGVPAALNPIVDRVSNTAIAKRIRSQKDEKVSTEVKTGESEKFPHVIFRHMSGFEQEFTN